MWTNRLRQLTSSLRPHHHHRVTTPFSSPLIRQPSSSIIVSTKNPVVVKTRILSRLYSSGSNERENIGRVLSEIVTEIEKFKRILWISKVAIAGIVTIGVIVYYGAVETVPFTRRKHVMIFGDDFWNMVGNNEFRTMMSQVSLPWTHTDPYDAKDVLRKVIDGLNRELLKELFACRKLGLKVGLREVDAFNWDMFVVEDNYPIFSKVPLLAGKIVMHRAVLELVESEDEMAALIAHEVAHFIGRHIEERMIINFPYAIFRILFEGLDQDEPIHQMLLSVSIPFSRKLEKEANNICLLLLAFGGYDPRAAPRVYEKLVRHRGISKGVGRYVDVHFGSKRFGNKMLFDSDFMKRAIEYYEEGKKQD